jgi:hypothetical protein
MELLTVQFSPVSEHAPPPGMQILSSAPCSKVNNDDKATYKTQNCSETEGPVLKLGRCVEKEYFKT